MVDSKQSLGNSIPDRTSKFPQENKVLFLIPENREWKVIKSMMRKKNEFAIRLAGVKYNLKLDNFFLFPLLSKERLPDSYFLLEPARGIQFVFPEGGKLIYL